MGMSNRERFIKIFKVEPGKACPLSTDLCPVDGSGCELCSYNNWWDQSYKWEPKKKKKVIEETDLDSEIVIEDEEVKPKRKSSRKKSSRRKKKSE